MSKKSAVILIVVIIIVSGLVLFIVRERQVGIGAPENKAQESSSLPQKNNPLLKSVNENFSDTLARYYFGGSVKSVYQQENGLKIELDGAPSDTPDFIATNETRIHKSSDSGNWVTGSIFNITAKSVVEVHVDYEKNGKFWITRDVYIVE